MPSKLWIASKPVRLDPVDTGYEHSYLVYDPDGDPTTGDEQIFRGGPAEGNGGGLIGVEKWLPIHASEDKLSGLDPFASRNYTNLDLDGKTPEQVKNAISQWIDVQDTGRRDDKGNIVAAAPYTIPLLLGSGERIPALNSNTTIRSALEYAGINFDANTPREGGTGTRIAPSILAGSESVYGAGDSTVSINNSTNRILYSTGGNNVYEVKVNASSTGKVYISEDKDAGTLDKILLKNINPSDVRLERTLGGDLNIYFFPSKGGGGDLGIVIPNQWKNGVPSINNLWIYPPDGSAPQVIALNLPDSIPLDLPDFLPDWLVPAGGIFGDVPAIPILRGWGDPLVLDLDGDGVEVTKMGFGTDRSMVYFDMDNDGVGDWKTRSPHGGGDDKECGLWLQTYSNNNAEFEKSQAA